MKGINELRKEKFVEKIISKGDHFGSIITKSNPKAPITLISFPYEQGSERDDLYRKEGGEYYPDSLRRFIPLIGTLSNPKISEDHEKKFKSLEVSDLGDSIFVNKGKKKKFKLSKNTVSLEENLEALREKLQGVYTENLKSETPFTIIGLSSSRESLFSFIQSFMIQNPEKPFEISKKLKLIVVSNTLDLREFYHHSNIHSGCCLRKLLTSFPQLSQFLEISYFGVVKEMIHEEELQFLEKNSEVFKKIIHSDEIDKETQISNLVENSDENIGVCVNLESLKVRKNFVKKKLDFSIWRSQSYLHSLPNRQGPTLPVP